jgi:uncharacterized protein
MVPFYLYRLDDAIPQSVSGLSQGITETYKRNIWVTPSGLFELPHLEFILKVIGPDRILWSGDYPYYTMDGTREFLEQLPVSSTDVAKISRRNAEGLLGL